MINLKKSVLTGLVAVISLSALAQASVKESKNGWHLKDKQQGYYGISLDKAYQLVKGKKSQRVIVAVIDSGIDTTHEDLKSILWTNSKETPGNGIDDDGNGYVDDVHGWNFLGGRDGRNVKEDSYEAARFYHLYKSKFENLTNAGTLNAADQKLYKDWLRAKNDITKDIDPNETMFIKKLIPTFRKGDSVIRADLKKQEYNGNDLKEYKATNPDAVVVRTLILNISKGNNDNYEITNQQILEEIEGKLRKTESVDAPPKDFRGSIVKDNETYNSAIILNIPINNIEVNKLII